MVTRLRKSIENKDKGFTLIELLVVIVIIGILAAIAIPIFLNQKKKAADAGVKSDVRSVATSLESEFTTNNQYPSLGAFPTTAGANVTIGAETVKMSPGDTVSGVWYNAATKSAATAFCVQVVGANGTNPTTGYIWESDNGGLQPSSVTSCPSTSPSVGPPVVAGTGYFTSAVGIS